MYRINHDKSHISARIIILLFALTYANIVIAEITPETDASIPFSIAISGGISLGSYESGLNWALIKYLKIRRNEVTTAKSDNLYPELMSSVGASAGSINALVSAIEWCVDDARVAQLGKNTSTFSYHNSIDNNLFRTLWLDVGVDEVLPANQDVYREGDAILTRAAFDKAINQIREILSADIFRAGCQIPFGMTVTRIEPVKMSIAGIEVENQRFMIPVKLQSPAMGNASGTLEIKSHLVNKDDPYLGNVLYLRERLPRTSGRYAITPEQLIKAVLASSAYPIAFSRIQLANCSTQESNDPNAKAYECPPGFQPRFDDFIDGGVFDNVPLGIAKALAEPMQSDLSSRERWLNSARPYNYIYLDPDIRRPVAWNNQTRSSTDNYDQATQEHNAAIHGIRSHLEFLQGAVSTGRNYELYNVLRSGDWTRQVYDYSCELLAAVSEPGDTSGHCEIYLDTDTESCQLLLNKNLIAGQILSPQEKKFAANCILQETLRLEDIYYGFQGRNLSVQQITKIRQQLIVYMRALAERNGNQQLALSIDTLGTDKFGDRRILLTTRFAPITGNMLGAFGAFIDKSFREYDFYAGVYDAVYGLADFFCKRRPNYQLCLATYTKTIYEKLGIPAVDDANTVFHLLAVHEHPDYKTINSPWSWLADNGHFPEQERNGNLTIIFHALADHTDPDKDEFYKEPKFPEFIQALFANGYQVDDSSQFMKRIKRLEDNDPETWYYPITSRASSRLLELEKGGTDDTSKLIRGTMGFGAFAVHSFVQDAESNLLIQSAAPSDSWLNWLPYEIGADFRNGGLVVSWLPGINFSDRFSLDLKITPAHLNRYAGDTIWFSQLDLYFSYRRKGAVSSFGIGPTYTYTWKEWPDSEQRNLGASAYVAFLQDRLRLSVGQRSTDNTFAGESIYLSISVMDIPGLTYWLTKGR